MDTKLKKNQDRFAARPGRLLIIGKDKWKYMVGHTNVVAYSEQGQKKTDLCWKVKGLANPEDFYRGQRKGTIDGSIFPAEVVTWLTNS